MNSDQIMNLLVRLKAKQLALSFMNEDSKDGFMKFMSDCYDESRGTKEEMIKQLSMNIRSIRDIEKLIESGLVQE